MQYIGSIDLAIPENYKRVCQLIDIESMIAFLEEKCFYSVFPNLMTNPEFRKQFVNRVSEMINSITKPEYINSMLEQIQEEIRPQVLETYNRYYEGIYTEEIYDEKMQIIKNFFEYRYEYLENFVEEERNL